MIRIARYVLMPALVGALALGSAWAGTGLAPAPVPVTPEDLVAEALSLDPAPPAPLTGSEGSGSTALGLSDSPTGMYAGAHKVNIYPNPPEGRVWQTEGCETMGSDAGPATFGHLGDLSTPWPADSDCIYVGGFGIGPMNATKDFNEELGLWVRSTAVSDGAATLVLTVVDGVYWMGEYGSMCDGCGAFDLQQELGAELGIDPAGLVFTATHAHAAPDFIGGWGGVPDWYMDQVADAMRESVRESVLGLEPASIEAGEILAREHNRERRNTYRSAEEAGLSWFRSLDLEGNTIATVGAYAAHPTSVGMGSWENIAHPDWPGVFNARAEENFGGIGLHFMTGLGNVSTRGGLAVGERLADLIPPQGEGKPVEGSVHVGQVKWDQPVTNAVLTALAGGGFFDRPFTGPAATSVSKDFDPETRPCVSTSPLSVHTGVSAARVGSLVFTAAPGEIFSNFSNVVKERAADVGAIAFPLGMANDAMGYIPQSFETFDEARQGLGFAGTDVTEYEDAYSIDRCFGDMALETTLQLLGQLQ